MVEMNFSLVVDLYVESKNDPSRVADPPCSWCMCVFFFSFYIVLTWLIRVVLVIAVYFVQVNSSVLNGSYFTGLRYSTF